MTNQEAFDTVVKHLYSMKKPSIAVIGGFESCAYHGRKGNRCAIGCLIPDALYKRKMEGMPVASLVANFPSVGELLSGVNMFLLASLQSVHDERDNWNKKKGGLNRKKVSLSLQLIARDYNLSGAVVES